MAPDTPADPGPAAGLAAGSTASARMPPVAPQPLLVPDEVLAELFREIMGADGWQRVLARLVPLLGGQAGLCIRLDRVHPRDSIFLTHGIALEYLPELARRDLAEDLIWRELLRRPAGAVFRSTDVIPASELRLNSLYRRIGEPTGMKFALLAVLQNQPQRFANVCVTRPDRDFGDGELALMRDLLPFLQVMLELEERIALGDAGRRQALASFDRSGQSVVILDRSGYALHCNPLARASLDREGEVMLKGGRLLFESVTVQTEFECALRLALTAAAGEADPLPQEVRVPRRGGRAPLVLSVISCSSAADRAILPEGAGAMVVVYDVDVPRVLPIERLAWLYQLTPAETRVCEVLYGAGSVETAAERLALTRHTIRSHLKSIYAKFGVSTQGQLMQKLSNSLWMSAGRGAPASPPTPET